MSLSPKLKVFEFCGGAPPHNEVRVCDHTIGIFIQRLDRGLIVMKKIEFGKNLTGAKIVSNERVLVPETELHQDNTHNRST